MAKENAMSDLGFLGWAFVAAGGIVILGFIIAYAELRNRKRTARERAVTEAATHRLYEEEERNA
jgi:hypothetical membrane protein